MNWQQQIEAQIAELQSRAGDYGGGSLDYIADTMKALKDVAVAAEQHVAEWDDADANLQAALDKLREVGDE